MSKKEIIIELKQMRNLNRRSITNELTRKYDILFSKLNPLEERVMRVCYIEGKSYAICGNGIGYCERQIKRIVHRSIDKINELIINEREL